LNKKNLQPINIFKLADSKNQGVVNLAILESSFKKLLPGIKNEVFYEAMNAFRVGGKKDSVSREDFEVVFNRTNDNKHIKFSSGTKDANSSKALTP
jgi:hypothetical protein